MSGLHFDKTAWKTYLFDDIASSISDRVDDPRFSGVDRYVGLEHLDPQSIKIRKWGAPDDVSATKLRFYPGDVIYGRRRAYQRKLGVADFEGICSAHALVLRAKEDVCLAKFLPYFLQTDLFHQKAVDISVGSLSPTINWKTLARQTFFLPSLKDQEKIIEIISSIDRTIEAYQDLPLETQRESMLHELLSAGGDDWTETTLGEVSSFISRRVLPNDLALETQYVGLEHVEPMTTLISTWGNVESVSSSVTPFEPEDTLFGRLRPYLHKVAFADFPGVCSPEILVLRTSAICEPRFLYLLCSLASTVKKCVDMSAGTRMPRTSAADLASIEVYLPPLAEQRRIVEIVSSMDEAIRATKQAIRDLKVLRGSLLTEILPVNDNG